MANYGFAKRTSRAGHTSQSKPIAGREAEMTRNKAGGFGFTTELPQAVRRALMFGTTDRAYYANKFQLTEEFFQAVTALADQNPQALATEIEQAGGGRAYKMSPPIVALFLLSASKNREAKHLFLDLFPQVVRTGSHLLEFVSYTRDLREIRSTGKVIKQAVWNWFDRREAGQLAYQLLKYRSRTFGQTISQRDILRMFHVSPGDDTAKDQLFSWVVGKGLIREDRDWVTVEDFASQMENDKHPLRMVYMREWLKANPSPENAIACIEKFGLTHEMVKQITATDGSSIMTPEVWKTLLMGGNGMPMTAMIRSLVQLGRAGVIKQGANDVAEFIEGRLTDREALERARIHPIQLFIAHAIYTGQGNNLPNWWARTSSLRNTAGRSRDTRPYDIVPRVADALERAVELTWDFVGKTGKNIFVALDISGSMGSAISETVPITYAQAGAALALQVAKKESNYFIGGFSTSFIPLAIRSNMSISEAASEALSHTMGGTDAAQGYLYAYRHDHPVDCFINITDNESWAGYKHPTEALASYRRKHNANAQAIYVTIGPYGKATLVDPKDKNSWDFVGFDANLFNAIQDIIAGDVT